MLDTNGIAPARQRHGNCADIDEVVPAARGREGQLALTHAIDVQAQRAGARTAVGGSHHHRSRAAGSTVDVHLHERTRG